MINLNFTNSDFPFWFKIINYTILLPIIFWPFVFFSTIFFFDNPNVNLFFALFSFFVVNIYPIYLIFIANLNAKLFKMNNFTGLILPSIILVLILIGLRYYVNSELEYKNKIKVQKSEEKRLGYIKGSSIYRISNDTVYRFDSIIIGADSKTFKIISNEWTKDENYCYSHGKRIHKIDFNSFEILENHYTKDKYSVYYFDTLLEDADPKSFFVRNSERAYDSQYVFLGAKKMLREVEFY